MNLKKWHKRLIGVAFLFLVVCVAFHFYYVNAQNAQCPSNYTYPDSDSFRKRFDLKFEYVSGNHYVLSRNCKEPDIVFTVSQTNHMVNPAIQNQQLKCSSYKQGVGADRASIDVYAVESEVFNLTQCSTTNDDGSTSVVAPYSCSFDDNTGLIALKIQLKGNNVPVSDLKIDPSACLISELWLDNLSTYPTSSGGSVEYEIPATPEISLGSQYIDCDSNTYKRNNQSYSITDGSFEARFCASKRRATSEGKVFNGNSLSPQGFKCDYNLTNIPTNPEDLEGDDYFTNLHSTYAKKVMTESDKYIYHYALNNVVEEDASCKITCEEAVDVEYGPPVASIAGMCFEYKVRVTSRVSCGMTEAPSPPKCAKDYCTPSPQCVHNGANYDQGGPNEDFDACVQSCDGGKYSKTCSTKCYQQVYGSISANAKVTSIYFDDLFATKILVTANNYVGNCVGYYDKNGSTISWIGNGTPGRWYCENASVSKWNRYGRDDYAVSKNDGFFRHYLGENNAGQAVYCSDPCSWTGCTGNVYLNESYTDDGTTYSLEKDCKNNMEKYNSLVSKCNSKASCSTTTAEFTISADYTKKGDTTKTTINFPYDYQKDTITHNSGGSVTSTQDQNNTTLLPNYPTTDDGVWGCYRNGSTDSDRYRSTWSFPGTWMNLKTGEISFSPKDSSNTVWYLYNKRFCIPADAKSVNATWWNAYNHKKLEETGLMEDVSVTSTEVNAVCPYKTTSTSVVNKSYNITESEIIWNIHANAKKFGYFGWEFNIDCFYAINNDPLCPSGNCGDSTTPNTTDEACDPDSEYRVRSTDTEDMFPSSMGEMLNSTDESGRTVGFNWSQYAINNKNSDYKSNPVRYMQELQRIARAAKANGTEIYSSDKLDYEFNLSPSTLRQMRKDGAGAGSSSNYTSFSDSGFSISSGVGRYKSAKIRSLDGNNKIPSGPELNCNNMLHYGSSACDPVHD